MFQIASLSWEFAIYGLIALGVVCLIGWAKLADLTPDASFTSGAVIAWWVSQFGISGIGLLAASLVAGAVTGAITWAIIQARVQPLLASLVVVGVAYSINWSIMERPLRSIDPMYSIYDPSNPVGAIVTAPIILVAVAIALYLFSMSSIGLALRASAENPGSLPNGVRISRFASFFFLVLGNGLGTCMK